MTNIITLPNHLSLSDLSLYALYWTLYCCFVLCVFVFCFHFLYGVTVFYFLGPAKHLITLVCEKCFVTYFTENSEQISVLPLKGFMCFTVEASCTHSHTFLKRILLYLYLGSGRVVQQQDSRYSHTSDNTVLHLPEAQQERHDKRQQVQLCGGHTSTQTSNIQTDPRKHKNEVTPTAYPPHLKHDMVIHHGSNRTDDHSSQRSSGDVEEGRHEELQREQHDHTCKTPQREGHIYRNFSFSILINTQLKKNT